MDQLPQELVAERDALLAEIFATFGRVTREGGVSMSEAFVVDSYGTLEERATARERDTDRHWQELVEDPDLNPWGWYLLYPFLDPIGFRYYLPVAMVLSVRSGDDEAIQAHLTWTETGGDWQLNQWSLLDPAQKNCVKRFLQYMWGVCEHEDRDAEAQAWKATLESYWVSTE
jgi:hypothetical protein